MMAQNYLFGLLVLIVSCSADYVRTPVSCHNARYKAISSKPECLLASKQLNMTFRKITLTPRKERRISPSGCYEVTGDSPSLWFNPSKGSDDLSFNETAICIAKDFHPQASNCSAVCERVKYQGYPCECHDIVTSDGFVLQTVRLPRAKEQSSNATNATNNTQVVWLQHGFEGSCVDWISQPKPSDTLAYSLFDQGFDVWMGNSRGNVFAFGNEKLHIGDRDFWAAVDLDTMASIDTPTVIDYVLNVTKQQKLSWVGHSQGTTQMFAALSRNYSLRDGRRIADALDSIGMMAPVAYVYHSTSLFFKFLAGIHFGEIYVLLGDRDFLGPKITWILHQLSSLCKIPKECPTNLWPIMGGGNFSNTDFLTYRNSTRYDPADTSVHNMEHWAQHFRHNRFGMYDHGTVGNKMIYGSSTPPAYNLSHISGVRMALFNGVDDDLGDMKDVARLLEELPKSNVAFHKQLEHYGHMDFVWGKDAHVKVYGELIKFLKQDPHSEADQVINQDKSVIVV